MIQWLQNYTGTGIHGVNIEKTELKNLRKEIKHYKKKYEKEDKEIMIPSDSEEKQPQDEQKRIDEEIKKKQQKRKNERKTISDEVLTERDTLDLQNYIPQNEEKSQENFEKLKKKCESLSFFHNIPENELNSIINAFVMERFEEGETIFSQGDNADKLYLLESGELECWKTFKKGDPLTYIKTYKEGDSFGELALMFNYKRNYTIKAKTNVVLFSLDRKDYKGIIQGAILKRREKYITTLEKVEILQNLTQNELGKICDIIVEKEFKEGEDIIKQNENEDEFMILHEGNCHSEKISDSGKPPQVLKEFVSSDIFGDAPWYKCEQRNYTVKADSDCIVFIINRTQFKRLVGSLENILKRKFELYQKFMKK